MREYPVQLAGTPACFGGAIDRACPSAAEDSRYVYREVLRPTESEVAALRAEDVI